MKKELIKELKTASTSLHKSSLILNEMGRLESAEKALIYAKEIEKSIIILGVIN